MHFEAIEAILREFELFIYLHFFSTWYVILCRSKTPESLCMKKIVMELLLCILLLQEVLRHIQV